MHKIIKWLFVPLTLGVVTFIVFFLISINSSEKLADVEPLTLKDVVVEKKVKDVWLKHFSKNEKSGYFYPVNEVYVKLDLNEKIINTITYKLSAPILDPYQTFCLKEELKHHDLKYYLQKDKNNIELLIFSEDVNKLNSLVKVLKNYQISAKLEPYKKDEM
jgi:hydroxymethylpyrimidine pyrophosphatase-like HAD family hydrolase